MNKQTLSRRDFIKKAGLGALAVTVSSVMPTLNVAAEEETAAPSFPFEWHDLDVDTVQERTYQGFYDLGGCSRAVFNGIVGLLAETYGYPYNQIPSEMFFNGHSGYGIGSLCGALGGAAAVLGLFVPTEDVDTLLAELETWYSETALPIYQPDEELVTTIANSVNCSDSLGKWMTAAGVEDRSDPLRKSRCAGLSADVAKKTIQLINVYYGLEEAEPETEAAAGFETADNQYIGTGTGMDGDVTVRVTVDDGVISDVEVLDQNETPGIGSNAIDELPSKFIGLSSADEIDAVDSVSGATVTSDALKEAVKAALAQIN
jgi:uncharacterized protein with FMN-binding domain